MMLRIVLVSVVALVLAGCVSTTETQLAKGVWQIDAEGSGRFAKSEVGPAISKKAAELTLAQGYTHFTLSSGARQNSNRLVYNPGGGYLAPSITNVSVVNQGFVVRMYRPGDRGIGNALDAQTVLANLKKK